MIDLSQPFSRRRFLAGTSCFGAFYALARLIPLPVLAADTPKTEVNEPPKTEVTPVKPKPPGPGDGLAIALIGCGGQGTGDAGNAVRVGAKIVVTGQKSKREVIRATHVVFDDL